MKQINPSLSNISGVCVSLISGGCTCETSTAKRCAEIHGGIFHEGITCGAATVFLGSCCLKDSENNTILPCQNLSYCDCATLADSFNFILKWTPFQTSTESCSDYNCTSAFDESGACCSGTGMCKETSKSDCDKMKHFFQGNGTTCIVDKINICSGGTGGCCVAGVSCNDNISGSTCLSEKKIYLGHRKKCYEYILDEDALPCFSVLPGYKLNIGDVVENCVVVGIYKPEKMRCFGNPIFAGSLDFNKLVDGTEKPCALYNSQTDYNGYGEILDGFPCDVEYSYIMLVSLDSLSVEERYEFTWSHGGLYFGPMISSSGKIIEEQSESIKNIKEGYILHSGLTFSENKNIIIQKSFSSCGNKRSLQDTEVERATRNTEQNFNGRWSSDWGIYNTIRMVNADMFYSTGVSYDAYLSYADYAPSADFNEIMIPIVDGVNKINKNTPRSDYISRHFIPSINELAYLADQCNSNNLNTTLLMNGGSPLVGEHWSSTGTFKYVGYTGGEGVYNGATGEIGSQAWSINFGINTIKKDNRLTNKKVRTIRLIRCDGKKNSNSALRKVNIK